MYSAQNLVTSQPGKSGVPRTKATSNSLLRTKRDLLDRCALQDMHQHVRMARAIGSYDPTKKAGRHRRQDPDVQTSDGAAARGAGGLDGEVELLKNIARLFEKTCAAAVTRTPSRCR